MTSFRATHRHYKGGLYQKLFDATHSETEELLTIYLTSDGWPFARPKAMFEGLTEDGVRRFEPIEDATDQKGVKFTAFSCWGVDELATHEDVDALASEIKQAFAAYFPDWKWNRSLREYPEGWSGVLFGPQVNEFYVLFEQGEDEWGPLFTFRIDNLSYSVPYGVEPLAGP